MQIVRDAPITKPGSGGFLRSLQIAELIAEQAHVLVDLYPTVSRPRRIRDRWARAQLVRRMKGHATVARSLDRMQRKRAAMQYAKMSSLMQAIPPVDLFLWERTSRHGAFAAARDHGIPSIAICHNLESLVATEQLSYAIPGDPHERFAAECEQLGLADSRIVISERDQWLLKLFGLESLHLPYFPPADRLAWLSDIRSERSPVIRPRRLLLMGSAFYEPTYRGMHQIIKDLAVSGVLDHHFVLDVAGFGSERLREICPKTGVYFHGSVSDESLAGLIKAAYAGIVYQASGSGSLTRIADYLIAGLPVIANPAAARDYEYATDLHVFRTQEELLAILSGESLTERAEPIASPTAAIAKFQDLLMTCARCDPGASCF